MNRSVLRRRRGDNVSDVTRPTVRWQMSKSGKSLPAS